MIQDIITRVKIALNNNYLIIKSDVSDDESEKPIIVVKLKVRNAFIDNPSDLTIIRKKS